MLYKCMDDGYTYTHTCAYTHVQVHLKVIFNKIGAYCILCHECPLRSIHVWLKLFEQYWILETKWFLRMMSEDKLYMMIQRVSLCSVCVCTGVSPGKTTNLISLNRPHSRIYDLGGSLLSTLIESETGFCSTQRTNSALKGKHIN